MARHRNDNKIITLLFEKQCLYHLLRYKLIIIISKNL